MVLYMSCDSTQKGQLEEKKKHKQSKPSTLRSVARVYVVVEGAPAVMSHNEGVCRIWMPECTKMEKTNISAHLQQPHVLCNYYYVINVSISDVSA